MKLAISSLALLSATAASALTREHGDHGSKGRFGFGDSCLNSCLTSHLSVSFPPERPTATLEHSAHITAYSSALSSLCGNTFPIVTAAIDSCLSASCTGTGSHTWDSSYATSLCSAYSFCASATVSDAACTGWYAYGSGFGMGCQGGWRGHGGPGGGPGGHGMHGDGNATDNARGEGRWGQYKGPGGYCRFGPSGTCIDGMVTTATIVNIVTDAQGAVQTSMSLEVRTGRVVNMEQVEGETETSAVGVPMSTASAAASHLGVKVAAALAGLAVGALAIL